MVTFCAGNSCCVATGVGAGTTVTVLTGSTVVAMGTTGSNGCVTLDIGSAGTYTVKIQFLGSSTVTTHTGQVLTCGQTKNYTDSAGQYFCCNCCLLSDANIVGASGLMLTDANGTYNTSYRAASVPTNCGGQVGSWTCQYDLAGVSTITQVGGPPVCTVGTGSTTIYYCVICFESGGNWTVTVQRLWLIDWCNGLFHTCPAHTFPGLSFAYTDVTSISCGGAGSIGSASKSLMIPSQVTCNPFTWSSSLTTVGTPDMPDPVGGTVVVQN